MLHRVAFALSLSLVLDTHRFTIKKNIEWVKLWEKIASSAWMTLQAKKLNKKECQQFALHLLARMSFGIFLRFHIHNHIDTASRQCIHTKCTDWNEIKLWWSKNTFRLCVFLLRRCCFWLFLSFVIGSQGPDWTYLRIQRKHAIFTARRVSFGTQANTCHVQTCLPTFPSSILHRV